MVTAKQNNNSLLQDLLRLGLNGDQNSYQQFLQQISKIIRVIVAKRIASAEVEDVVQEVLISVHKARHTYDGARPLMPWLMAITNFRVQDYLRKYYAEMRHKTSNIEEFSEILADVTNCSNGHELVSDLLNFVDDKQRKILTMIYVNGHTAKETGKLIGMNESAVKVAAHRAIKKLKQQFPQG